MKSIQQIYHIQATPSQVWQALVNPSQIEGWGAGPAEMDTQEGKQFSLWGGEIWGVNTKVVPEQMLGQEWYGGQWLEPSLLTITLKAEGAETILTLEQSNIPDDEAGDIEEGWKIYYFGPLKEYVEEANK